MKHALSVVCGVMATLVFPLAASAQSAHAINSPKAEFHIMSSIVVGSETLAPGDYTFQCKTIDGQEFLIVTSSENGHEVTRVPCRPEELTAKVGTSDYRSTRREDGVSVLTAVRIKGETIAHRLVVD